MFLSLLFLTNFLKFTNAQCSDDLYSCKSWDGIFIPNARDACQPLSFICDGHADCPLGDDEWNCTNCEITGFTCNKSSVCINKNYECDGVWDCPNQEDEDSHCGSCNATQWSCTSTGRCINLSQLCDGNIDCLKGEDELAINCNGTIATTRTETIYVYVGKQQNVNTITIIFIILVSVLIILLLCFMFLFLRYYIQTKSLENRLLTTNSNIISAENLSPSLEPMLATNVITANINMSSSPRLKSKTELPKSPNKSATNDHVASTPRQVKLNNMTPIGLGAAARSTAGRVSPICLGPVLANIINTSKSDDYIRQESEPTEIVTDHKDGHNNNNDNEDENDDDPEDMPMYNRSETTL